MARAQGTLEYLIVIGAILAMSLIAILIFGNGVLEPASVIKPTARDSAIKYEGIKVVDASQGADDRASFSISNSTSENLIIKSVKVDGVNHSFGNGGVIGVNSQKAISIMDLVSSCSGSGNIVYSVQITFVTEGGTELTSDLGNVSVKCSGDATTPSGTLAEVDLNAPFVSLISPAVNSVSTSPYVAFSFNASDNNGIKYCELDINGVSKRIFEIIANNSVNIMVYNFSALGNKNYVWDVNCVDYGNNSFKTSTKNFGVSSSSPSLLASWARGAMAGSGTSHDLINQAVFDSKGNMYAGGLYESDTNMGRNVKLIHGGYDQLFVAKYDAMGNIVWARGPLNDEGIYWSSQTKSVAVDSSGNVYAAGVLAYPTDFGNGVVSRNTFGNDFFLVKYNSEGLPLWERGPTGASGSGNDSAWGVVVDSNGNVYVTGITASPLTFAEGVSVDSNLFLAKYDSSGNAVWARTTIPGSASIIAKSIAIDVNNNIYLAGDITGDVNFSSSVTLTAVGSFPMNHFVAKYNSDGNILWAKTVTDGSSNYFSQGNTIAVDSNGAAYIGGIFFSSMTLGPGITLNDGLIQTPFVAKYDSSGNAVWAKDYNIGTGYYSLATDLNNNLYEAGYIRGDINVGSISLYKRIPFDLVIMKYDSNGTPIWAKQSSSGTTGSAIYPMSIDYDPLENTIAVAGYSQWADINFGSTAVLTQKGGFDFFLTKYEWK